MIRRQWITFVVACLVVATAAFGAGAGSIALFNDAETISGSFSVSEDADRGIGHWTLNATAPENGTIPENGTVPGNGTAPENGSAPENGTAPGNGTTPDNGSAPENGTDQTDGENASEPNATGVEVTGVTLVDDAVPVGNESEVRVDVANPANHTATFTATLTVDGNESHSETVELASGANATLSMRHAFGSPGNYTLGAAGTTAGTVTVYEPAPDVSVTSASVEATTVEPNESVTATAVVANAGTASGDIHLDLAVNGTVVDGQNATVAAGQTTTVDFEHALPSSGTYELAIGDVGAGTVTVVDPVGNASEGGSPQV